MKKMTVDYKENVEKDKNALKYSVKNKPNNCAPEQGSPNEHAKHSTNSTPITEN
jgi:hypothetical protein